MTITHGLYIEKKREHFWIRLPNAVKKENITQIQNRIESSLTGYKGRVVIDLSDTLSIFSILIHKYVTKFGGQLQLVNVSEKCQAQLKLMNLDKILNISKKKAGKKKKVK